MCLKIKDLGSGSASRMNPVPNPEDKLNVDPDPKHWL
jgi:hypothetical protein